LHTSILPQGNGPSNRNVRARGAASRAVAVNIEIMRAFVRLRLILASNKELARRRDAMEAKTDAKFSAVFEAIRQFMAPPEPKKRPIGFAQDQERKRG
jgi:hypothetical protein